MTGRSRSGPAALLLWLVAALSWGVGAGPAQAATCTDRSGVSVIVDFGSSIRTGCAAGDPASAWAAIQAAGFGLEGTQRFPGSFICRVAGYPAPADEACIQTPPASAYWALWSAPAGGGWSYSATGAATLNPAPGTAIGLAFGAGRQPGLAPSAPAAPPATTSRPPSTSSTTKPSTTKPSTTTPSTTTARAASSNSSRPPAATSTGAATGPAGSASRSATSPSRATTPAASSASDATESSPAAAPAGDSTPDAGVAAGAARPDTGPDAAVVTIVAGAGIGLLLVLGALVVRRQRDRAMNA